MPLCRHSDATLYPTLHIIVQRALDCVVTDVECKEDETAKGQPILVDRLDLSTFPRYTDLQSSVKCLDHGGIVLVLDTVCSQARVVLGCAMLL